VILTFYKIIECEVCLETILGYSGTSYKSMFSKFHSFGDTEL